MSTAPFVHRRPAAAALAAAALVLAACSDGRGDAKAQAGPRPPRRSAWPPQSSGR